MSTTTELKEAFKRADAIMALEGFEMTPEIERLQEAVIAGRMTFDQAVKTAIERTTNGTESSGT